MVAGPPDDAQRANQYRPKTLELTFSDGTTCWQLPVKDVGTVQTLELPKAIATQQIRIAVTDVYPPDSDAPVDVYAITEVWVMARPR